MSQTVLSFQGIVKEPAQFLPKVKTDPFTSSVLLTKLRTSDSCFSAWSRPRRVEALMATDGFDLRQVTSQVHNSGESVYINTEKVLAV